MSSAASSSSSETLIADRESSPHALRWLLIRGLSSLEELLVPLLGFMVSMSLFGVFIALVGKPPLEVFAQMYRGAFGTTFSFQNTLMRAAPLMLTGLCTALPARLGLIVIGGEGALVVGGVTAAAVAPALSSASSVTIQLAMALAATIMGGLWIAAAGWLKVSRGVNETISSLLLSYLGIALMNHLVEGPLKDPASLNKPSTFPIGEANMLPNLPGMDLHYGLLLGVLACLLCSLLMDQSRFGFASRVVGGNVRAARLAGLPVARLVVLACFLGGAAAGLAGMIEVAAVHGKANGSLICGYGYTGILVAFLARHSPLAVMPVALLLGGISASGGLLQRSFGLPDASVNVLQGVLFVVLLTSESYRGKLRPFRHWTQRV
ncbi:MAG TPA: ABC transporter permease [Polyangiaceae bacterium]|nr:ABC transporter permease [Polyangiaceae bacterium]